MADNVNALKTLRHNIDVEFHKMFEKAKVTNNIIKLIKLYVYSH